MLEAFKWLCGFALVGVLKWAFDNFAWDAFIQFFETRVGLKEADVITAAFSFIIPVAITICAVMGIYGVVRYEQQTRQIDSNYRAFDMNGCDAIFYIAINSLAGTTFSENNKSQLARTAFYEAAKRGKIQVAGMAEGSTLLENIPKRIWDGKNRLDSRCMQSERSLRITWKDEEKILYWGLMVDRREIQKTWPEAPTRHERA
jgi:hypothetical protein